jgi:Tfp pilus assembly protein PilN
MTRLSRNGESSQPRRLAAVCRAEDQWRLVVADASGGKLSIVEARTVRDPGGLEQLQQVLREQKVGLVIRLAPAQESVARAMPMPAGAAEALPPALGLLAEAELPETLPPHRRAAGAIGSGAARAALLTGWAGAAPAPLTGFLEEVWTTPAAALAGLRQRSGYAVATSAGSGVISVVASGADRTIARVLREDNGPGVWDRAVQTAITDTLRAVGVELAPRPGPAPEILLDTESLLALKSRVTGLREESRWISEYALPIGALLLAASPDPLLHPLCSLTASGKATRDPLPERAAAWLSRPRHAAAVAGAAVAIMLLAPLGFAAARLAVLHAKSSGLSDAIQARKSVADQAALYAQLETIRWPMTKLLADIASCTPVGVVVDNLRISTDQNISIQGTAETYEQLNSFQKNLAQSRVFKDVAVPRYETSEKLTSFELSAAVANPASPLKADEDFAAKPLAVRLYGEKATNTTPPLPPRGKELREARAPAARSTPGGEIGGSRSARSGEAASERRAEGGESRRPQTGDSDALPAALTEEQIGKMDLKASMREWSTRKSYEMTHPKLEAADKARLEDEITKTKARMDEAKKSPAPAAGGGA